MKILFEKIAVILIMIVLIAAPIILGMTIEYAYRTGSTFAFYGLFGLAAIYIALIIKEIYDYLKDNDKIL